MRIKLLSQPQADATHTLFSRPPLLCLGLQLWYCQASLLWSKHEEVFVSAFLVRLLKRLSKAGNLSCLVEETAANESPGSRAAIIIAIANRINVMWESALAWRRKWPFSALRLTQSAQRSALQLDELFRPLGGHTGAWILPKKRVGTAIIKKTSLVEGAFYAAVTTELRRNVPGASHPELWAALSVNEERSRWLTENGGESALRDLEKLVKFIPHIYTLGTDEKGRVCYVEMENLTAGTNKPPGERPHYCAMDLKIGTRLWGIDADDNKKDRMIAKAKCSTAAATGLCVIAYRCTDPVSGEVIKTVTRRDTRDVVDPKVMYQHLATFFSLADRHTLLEMHRQVSDLIAFFRVQRLTHFHSSSLLLVFDSRGRHSKYPPIVRIIDFAHASLFHQDIDRSFLTGLINLNCFIRLLCQHRTTNEPNNQRLRF